MQLDNRSKDYCVKKVCDWYFLFLIFFLLLLFPAIIKRVQFDAYSFIVGKYGPGGTQNDIGLFNGF